MTMGIADNLLLSVIRAWDTTGKVDFGLKDRKPVVFVAPGKMRQYVCDHCQILF